MSRASLHRCLLVLVIAIAAFTAHAPALPGAFVWDDANQIAGNPLIRAPDGLLSFWTSTEQPDYWPLAYSTHWLEWRAFGPSATGYRVVNLALHIANALLVWAILTHMAVPAAWFCALVFAVHPVTIEAVAWILQRKTLLSTACACACLLVFLAYLARPSRTRYVSALVLFAFGMLSKSAVVTWPGVLILIAWWQRRRLERRDVLLTIPFWIVAGVLGAVGWWFQHHRAIGSEIVRDDGLLSRLALAGRAVWFYAGQALWPVDLSFIYPRWQIQFLTPVSFLPLLALVALLAIAWSYRGSWSRPAFASLTYYVLALFPALGLVDIYFMRYSLVADHWQYLALPGLLALAFGGAAWAIPRWLGRLAPIAVPAGVVLVAFLVFQARHHATTFSGADNTPLWRRTLAANPTAWIAHNNLAALHFAHSDLAAARAHNEAALALNPRYHEAETALGDIALVEGRVDEALRRYRRALDLKPDYVFAISGLALVEAVHGDADRALRSSPAALGRPDAQASWLALLGRALLAQGRARRAVAPLRESARLEPAAASTLAALATAQAQSADYRGAVVTYRRYLELVPGDPRATIALARLLATRHAEIPADPLEAIRLAEPACATANPPVAAFWDTLAVAYAAGGQFDRAVAAAEKALALASTGDPAGAAAIRHRLQLFRSGQPYVGP